MNAMNIKEREYKYDFFISIADTILSVGNLNRGHLRGRKKVTDIQKYPQRDGFTSL